MGRPNLRVKSEIAALRWRNRTGIALGMGPPVVKPVRRNPDRTRRRLLQAAVKLFSERGFHGVSVDEIVARARSNKRMVYHYFGSKTDLYVAALEEGFGRLSSVEFKALVTQGGPREQLQELLTAYFQFLDTNPEFYRLLLWVNLEEGRPIAKSPARLKKNPFQERFRLIVEEGVRQGIFRAPVDIGHLLVNFFGLCLIYYSNRYSLTVSVGMDMESARSRVLRVQQAVDLAFHGLLADPR